ncbi:hypothetical protein [Microvirga zambiensis]|uniref:hypothetical protein n=1 Tax=Microvirga zambiensis TaxID=1402137 RepID=UPI001AF01AE9|nr:hypothetical protein [Microvirga zambiensis]
MQLDDPFPLEELPVHIRQTILEEFGGRRPSIREVASLPDTHWLQLPHIGPRVLASIRELTRGARRKARLPSLAGMTDAELEAEFDRLSDERRAVDTQLKEVKAEIRLRSEAKRYADGEGAF